jgi:plastocyanin
MTRWPRWIGLCGVLTLACGVREIVPPGNATLVAIGDDFYQPDSVTIAVGGSVRWTNGGVHVHRVVADDGSFVSATITPTAWFQHRFDSTGTFHYHCLADSTHAETGVVVVQ